MTLWICSHKTILRESSDRNPQREDVITPEGVDGRSVGPLFRFEILTAPRPLKRVLHFAILHSSSVFRQWQRRRKWSNKVTNGPERHLTAADLVGLECLLRSVFGLPTATDNRGPSPPSKRNREILLRKVRSLYIISLSRLYGECVPPYWCTPSWILDDVFVSRNISMWFWWFMTFL